MNRAFKALVLAVVLSSGCARDIDPETSLVQARSLLTQGKSGEARILLKNLLAAHPKTPMARVLLAQMALDDGNAQAASDELSVLDERALADPAALQLQARVEIEVGKPEDALKRLQASGELISQPQRALLLASAYRALESPGDALVILREAEAVSGPSEPMVLSIAETLAAMGNIELATAELDRYLSSTAAQRADALRMRGDLKLREGNPEEAAKDFNAALAAAPPAWPLISRVSTQLMIADSQIAQGEIDAAKAQLDKIEKSWPGTLGATVLRGQVALLEGRPDEAAERLGAVVAAGAGSERIQYLLIDALIKSGNTVRANELLEQLVAAEPEGSPTRRVLAAMYMQQGRPDRVIEILGADAELGIGDSMSVDDDLLAAARLAQGRSFQQISTLTAKLAKSPDDARLRAELATAQLVSGEPAVALLTLGKFTEGPQDPLGIATRLSALYATGNSIEANQAVDWLLSKDARTDLSVLLAAIDAAALRQQHAIVSRLLDRAVALAPANPEVQIRRASLSFAQRKFEEATATLNDMLQRNPSDSAAQLALARVAEARGDIAGSRKVLEATAVAHPTLMEPSLMLASLELRANKAQDASKALDRLIKANTDSSVPNAAGLLLSTAGRYEEARTRFRQAIELDKGRFEYWFNLGETQLALKDVAAAQQSFLRSAELQPESLRSGFAAVRISLEQKDMNSARRIAETLVAKLPNSSTSWLLLGETKAAADDNSGALVAFAHSYAVRPNSLAAKREFAARIATGAQRPEEPLQKWVTREPADTVTRLLLADFFLQREKNDDARKHLEIIVKQSPNNVAALNNLAWILRSSQPDRAESLAKRAQAIAPDNSAISDTLGVILLANGKFNEAVAALERAAAGLPQNQSVQFHYATSLSKVGQKEKARAILGDMLKDKRAFPDRAAAQRLIEELG
ncbi:MAG: XrtA/PEP-CTERM system TPR-repeat protein PrsT [Pseudomonadota bacterium]